MADKEIAVSINDIHKEFILPQSKNSTFKQTVVNIVKKNNKVTQKTLDGVSFDIHKGDFFGIVGRNGSGKSTLLKLIAGVYTPTAGSIDVHGGLTPFIELGVGFNPELSGRDNVYLNGALLGFTREQMTDMYDEIVDFAELGPFMDQKLKNYSSGMQVRLAFSIAIKAKNDVLIFDEVLAVGDEAFQRKCLDVFEGYKASGQTVILVSHDMETVRQFCNRAVLINDGKNIMIGDPRKIAKKYSELNQDVIDAESSRKNEHASDNSISIKIFTNEGKERASFRAGEEMLASLNWDKVSEVDHVVLNIYKQSGEHITGFRYANIDNESSVWVSMRPNVMPGRYQLALQLFTADNSQIGDEGAIEFNVKNEYVGDVDEWSGLVYVSHAWAEHKPEFK